MTALAESSDPAAPGPRQPLVECDVITRVDGWYQWRSFLLLLLSATGGYADER